MSVETRARKIRDGFADLVEIAKKSGMTSIVMSFNSDFEKEGEDVRELIVQHAEECGYRIQRFVYQTRWYLEVFL